MRVLQIANYKEGAGGISSQVELIARHLKEERYECEVYSTKGGVVHRALMPLSLLKKGKRYDVFHIHACSFRGFFPAIIGITIGRFLNKRILLTYHGGDAAVFFDKYEKLVKFFLSRTYANIVLSGYLGEIFERYAIPYTIIPNIIEFSTKYFKTRQVLQPHFVCIRSLRPIYNIPCILRAFQIVKNFIPDASLALVGDGISMNELKKYVMDNSIQDVTFYGRVPNSKIPSILLHEDIMLSAPIIDNMPVSLLEGFNSGLLVISSSVGGVPYMIENGVNGLLFDSDDASMLADKMLYACSHPEHTKEMINNAYRGLTSYSWDSIRKKYLALYQ